MPRIADIDRLLFHKNNVLAATDKCRDERLKENARISLDVLMDAVKQTFTFEGIRELLQSQVHNVAGNKRYSRDAYQLAKLALEIYERLVAIEEEAQERERSGMKP